VLPYCFSFLTLNDLIELSMLCVVVCVYLFERKSNIEQELCITTLVGQYVCYVLLWDYWISFISSTGLPYTSTTYDTLDDLIVVTILPSNSHY